MGNGGAVCAALAVCVERMARVRWKPIFADLTDVSAPFLACRLPVMAAEAQALQVFRVVEQVRIAVVRSDVVGDRGGVGAWQATTERSARPALVAVIDEGRQLEPAYTAPIDQPTSPCCGVVEAVVTCCIAPHQRRLPGLAPKAQIIRTKAPAMIATAVMASTGLMVPT